MFNVVECSYSSDKHSFLQQPGVYFSRNFEEMQSAQHQPNPEDFLICFSFYYLFITHYKHLETCFRSKPISEIWSMSNVCKLVKWMETGGLCVWSIVYFRVFQKPSHHKVQNQFTYR